MKTRATGAVALLLCLPLWMQAQDRFVGKHFSGVGNAKYFQLLETSRRMMQPDAELQNLSMLYFPKWDGFVEGPTWDAWWIQNSYGTTYAALPLLEEPYVTWIQNAQDLWFDQMGDGKRAGENHWVAPDGCLCDCAKPGWIYYRQGDGQIQIHDWAMEFTAAGVVLQSELLLISRDQVAIDKYLPKLERSANFIESRRDPKNNLFLAGPAGNLLAPSYAGWKKPDGTYGKAYLAGLSVTYIAALDRLIQLEKLSGHEATAEDFRDRRERASEGLKLLTEPEGYLVRSIDPDGTKHGVFGAAQHGYLETSPNQDAICFRVVDDAQAGKIYDKIASIPQLRPHAFLIPNYPGYDDMYEKPEGLWSYGYWVNGGDWSTCEARMIMAYYRLGKFDDAVASMEQLLKFARDFRMDNPLTDFGNAVYQPTLPINNTYDAFGPPAAFVRGLFEYVYSADGVKLIPHVPPGITELHQLDPIRFGGKKVYISYAGPGDIKSVTVNGVAVKKFDGDSVELAYGEMPEAGTLHVVIQCGDGKVEATPVAAEAPATTALPPDADAKLVKRFDRLNRFMEQMKSGGMDGEYDFAHAKVARDAIAVIFQRRAELGSGQFKPLPDAKREAAADQSYIDAANVLYDGLDQVIATQHCKCVGIWNSTK